ncbi:uncharacterized protein LOC143542363 [Bidens hawaiensis]|uniref:uncharacterized protein LOC143542363 n=1 Tax=Bidens hawaiensis TaxID=980011 RepID=UPI004049897D
MSGQSPETRPAGGTEYSWCRAVPGGTGITVLSILFSKPLNPSHLQSCIHKLQFHHPILNSKLQFNPTNNTFNFTIPTTQNPLKIQFHTSDSFNSVIELELNTNLYQIFNKDSNFTEIDKILETHVMFASLYELPEEKWAVVLRLHTAVCDRTTAASLLKELLGLYNGDVEIEEQEGLGLGFAIEDLVPAGKTSKWFWARGADMIGNSVNSFRFSNLGFKEIGVPSSTKFVRLKVGSDDTDGILSGCKSKGIKLFGLIAAAGFIAAHASKNFPNEKWEKYSLATLIDCRSELDPVHSDHHIGFYHSVIINSHDIKEGEDLWDLAQRIYTTLKNAKNNNKHFTDTADLNYLMCKAIENPGLTPSSSLRTSLLSVFEDPLIENTNHLHKNIGLLDCVGCSSVHGVGPSLAIFDTIRDGELDCACVYPSPTHSREQMQDYVDHIKKIIIDGSK